VGRQWIFSLVVGFPGLVQLSAWLMLSPPSLSSLSLPNPLVCVYVCVRACVCVCVCVCVSVAPAHTKRAMASLSHPNPNIITSQDQLWYKFHNTWPVQVHFSSLHFKTPNPQ
jgi:hypothetical protein